MLLSNSYDRKIGKLTASQHVHNLFIYFFFKIYFLAQLNENLDANLYICLIKEDKELAKFCSIQTKIKSTEGNF